MSVTNVSHLTMLQLTPKRRRHRLCGAGRALLAYCSDGLDGPGGRQEVLESVNAGLALYNTCQSLPFHWVYFPRSQQEQGFTSRAHTGPVKCFRWLSCTLHVSKQVPLVESSAQEHITGQPCCFILAGSGYGFCSRAKDQQIQKASKLASYGSSETLENCYNK